MKKQQMKRAAVALAVTAALGLGVTVPSAYAEPLTDDVQYGGSYGAGNLNVQALRNYSADEPMALSEENLPETYDLRNVDGVKYSTSVKNQHRWGVCWTFATMASLESSMLKHGVTGLGDQSEPDLSELQLAWFASTPLSEETYEKTTLLTSPMDLHDQIGEGSSVKVNEGMEEPLVQQVMNKGAGYTDAIAALSSWQGVVSEEDLPYGMVPYPGSSDYSDDEPGLSEEYRNSSSIHVQNVDQLPSPATFSVPITSETTDYSDYYVHDSAAQDAIKKSLMDEGAVTISYFANSQKQYFNSNYAQYVNKYITTGDESTMANHAVAIVGWDDNYSKENFGDLTADPADRITPPGDGAWIIKNSWGSNWADGGYFYLSYYDMTIDNPTKFIYDSASGSGAYSYDYNYQYDFLGSASVAQIKPNAFGEESQFANVFTAGSHEKLAAVSVMSVNPNSTVEYKVYRLNDGATGPTDGTLVAEGEQTIEYAGYHTIDLDEQIDLQAGERFSVVETVEGRDGRYVPLEIAARDICDTTSEKHQSHQEAKVSAGQSYISQDDGTNWTDVVEITADDIDVSSQILPSELGNDFEIFSTGNVELKAFTVKASDPDPDPDPTPDPEPTPDPDVDPDDGDRGSDADKDTGKDSDKQSDKSNASDKSAVKPIAKTGAAVAGVAAVVVVLVVVGVAIVAVRSRKEHSGR